MSFSVTLNKDFFRVQNGDVVLEVTTTSTPLCGVNATEFAKDMLGGEDLVLLEKVLEYFPNIGEMTIRSTDVSPQNKPFPAHHQ